MKKILYYCEHFYPMNTGYSNAFKNFLEIFSKDSEYQIDVITPSYLGEEKEISLGKNIKIIRLKKILNIRYLKDFINSFKYYINIKKINKKNNYNLIFIETLDDPLMLSFFNRDLLKKTIVRLHSTSDTEYTVFSKHPVYILKKIIIKILLKNKLINILSTNNYHIEFYKKYFLNENSLKIAQKRFFVLENTLGEIEKKIETEKIEIEKNNQKKIKIIILGRLDRLGYLQKGFMDFMDSIILANKTKKLDESLEILIIGKGSYKNKIIEIINKEKLSFIKLEEYLENKKMIEKLKESDVAILPSVFEGMSMFALEALKNKNLLILSKTGGLVELVQEGKNGYYFNPKDTIKLAEIILEITKLEFNKIELMKGKSEEIYMEKFSPKILKKKLDYLVNILE